MLRSDSREDTGRAQARTLKYHSADLISAQDEAKLGSRLRGNDDAGKLGETACAVRTLRPYAFFSNASAIRRND